MTQCPPQGEPSPDEAELPVARGRGGTESRRYQTHSKSISTATFSNSFYSAVPPYLYDVTLDLGTAFSIRFIIYSLRRSKGFPLKSECKRLWNRLGRRFDANQEEYVSSPHVGNEASKQHQKYTRTPWCHMTTTCLYL